jgi:hypothetical protein
VVAAPIESVLNSTVGATVGSLVGSLLVTLAPLLVIGGVAYILVRRQL